MNYPYELDGFCGVYISETLEQISKPSLETNIQNLTINKVILKNLQEKEIIPRIKKRENPYKQAENFKKKIKLNSTCKRCNVYSFDKCECMLKSFQDIYISGKRRKITLV